uniref:DNA pilot protein n=1 Tax=Dulem virus 215 TaxID=3145692 RepID=A0AAU8AXE9_9VIRU
MAFAAAGAAIAGLASNAISASQSKKAQARAYGYAKKLQQHQYDLSIRGYKETPGAQREGYESAGYNPMLALGNVGGTANVAGGTPVAANATDTTGIRDSVSQAIQLRNQTEQVEAQNDEFYASADRQKTEKALLVEKLPYVGKQAKADYMKTTMESAKLENDIHYQNEYLNYLENSLKVQERLGQLNYQGTIYNAKSANEASHYASDTSAANERLRLNTSEFNVGIPKFIRYTRRSSR